MAANSVSLDSLDAELTLLRGEPAGLRGIVWEEEEAEQGDDGSDTAFDDEKPVVLGYLMFSALRRGYTYHCQPAIPLTLSSVENVAAAMRPEHPVLTT